VISTVAVTRNAHLKFERLPHGLQAGIDSSVYRQLMRHQAAGVSVVATGEVGSRVGLTATSVASLSDSPPKLLVCVGRAAQAHDAIHKNGVFSVNFLAAGHQALAQRFAGRHDVDGESRFLEGRWSTLETGAPVLADALSSLDCRLLESHTFSTHSIFIGRVVAGCNNVDADPLVYFRGGYREISRS
jgi:cob(II)yrinic acid a,c-diamide reductase